MTWSEQRVRLERARQQCRNTMNWTDGGHWLGSGPEPHCYTSASQNATKLVTLIPLDPFGADVINAVRDDAATLIGRAGAATSVIGALSGLLVSTGVGIGIGIGIAAVYWALGESVARIPNVHANYQVKHRANVTASLNPMSDTRSALTQTNSMTILNHHGSPIYSNSGTTSIPLSDYSGDTQASRAMDQLIDSLTSTSFTTIVYLSEAGAEAYDMTAPSSPRPIAVPGGTGLSSPSLAP